jgi:hypothetical protein
MAIFPMNNFLIANDRKRSWPAVFDFDVASRIKEMEPEESQMSEQAMMTVGQVKAATGATRARLRYWQSRGIVSPIIRRHNTRDWRLYPVEQVNRVRTLMLLLDGGMTLRGAVARMAVEAGSPAAPVGGPPVASAIAMG